MAAILRTTAVAGVCDPGGAELCRIPPDRSKTRPTTSGARMLRLRPGLTEAGYSIRPPSVETPEGSAWKSRIATPQLNFCRLHYPMGHEPSSTAADQAYLHARRNGNDHLQAAFNHLRGIFSESGSSPWQASPPRQETFIREWADSLGLLLEAGTGHKLGVEACEAPWTAVTCHRFGPWRLADGTVAAQRQDSSLRSLQPRQAPFAPTPTSRLHRKAVTSHRSPRCFARLHSGVEHPVSIKH